MRPISEITSHVLNLVPACFANSCTLRVSILLLVPRGAPQKKSFNHEVLQFKSLPWYPRGYNHDAPYV
jgi:hypothetical protein